MPVGSVEIGRWFKGRKIVEAKKPLYIDPTFEDIRKAKPNDPNKCVFSRACQREFGSKAVIFLGTIAYVDRGEVVERYRIPPKGQLLIRAFDAGYKVKPQSRPGDFTLQPPEPSHTRAALKKSSRKYAVSRAKTAGNGKKKRRSQIQNARLIALHSMVRARA